MLFSRQVQVLAIPAIVAAAAIDYGAASKKHDDTQRQTIIKRALPGLLSYFPDFMGLQAGEKTISTVYKVKRLKTDFFDGVIHERVMFGPYLMRASNVRLDLRVSFSRY